MRLGKLAPQDRLRRRRFVIPAKERHPRRIVSRGGNPPWIPARAALGRNDDGFDRSNPRDPKAQCLCSWAGFIFPSLLLSCSLDFISMI